MLSLDVRCDTMEELAYIPLSLGDIVHDILLAAPILAWVLIVVVYVSKVFYEKVNARVNNHWVAVYYTRKLIHILAGGFAAIMVYLFFKEPFIPLVLGMLLALLTYLPHRTGKLMYWFQDPNNIAEVYFCIAWGLCIASTWYLDKRIGVVPVLFMAFGDGVTGIIRNYLFKRRVKHWSGNLGMFIMCTAIGLPIIGTIGIVVAAVSSIIEMSEIIDDNISVPLSSYILLLLAKLYGIL